MQVPHSGIVRVTPHSSTTSSGPHAVLFNWQRCVSEAAWHPHCPSTPAPPHVSSASHTSSSSPQSIVRSAPQLSSAVSSPLSHELRAQNSSSVSGTHEHMPATSSPHVSPAPQTTSGSPQLTVRSVPQLSMSTHSPHST